MGVFTTAETGYMTPPSVPAAARAALLHWSRRDVEPFIPTEVNNEYIANVEVNHARWVANCPFCSSAQFASPEDKRFFCADCLNAQAGFKFIPTNWPVDADAIESELLRRSQDFYMNWKQGETVQDLRNEWNLVQGLSNVENPGGVRPAAALLASLTEDQTIDYTAEREALIAQIVPQEYYPPMREPKEEPQMPDDAGPME